MFRLNAVATAAVAIAAGCTSSPGTRTGTDTSAVAGTSPTPPVTCADNAGWNDPAVPRRVFGNTWYVGTCGISSVLITSDAGHIVIDAGTERGGELVLANIRALGFNPDDIRYVLNTHAHVDHAGGLATLQRASGAAVLVHRDAAAALERGSSDASDPQFGQLPPFPTVQAVPFAGDQHEVRIGDLELVAHATPGHAAGGTSWTWTSCEAGICRRMAFVDSLSAVAAKGYRFSAQVTLLDTFRATFARVETLPCDVLITPHPSASRMWQRLGDAASEPLVDPGACRRYADAARVRLDTRLADEAAGRAP